MEEITVRKAAHREASGSEYEPTESESEDESEAEDEESEGGSFEDEAIGALFTGSGESLRVDAVSGGGEDALRVD